MNIPKLRFKQFTTNWNRTSLNHVATIETGFTPSTSNNSYWNGDYSWLSIADMNQGKYIFNTSKTITNIATKNKPIIKKGTLIMSFKLTIGKLGILKKDMYTNEAICHFNWKNNINISTEFMYYLLSSMNIKKYGSQAAKGITLNKDSLKSIPVQLPPIEEQFKIASFLSSVDNKIELLKDKKDKYVEFKHYLLQNLFPRNEELTPKLRFTEYTSEWKLLKLKNISNKIGDGLHSTPCYVNQSKFYFINGNNLNNGSIIIDNNTKCIDETEYNKYHINLTNNTLLISINGTIGNMAYYNNENIILGKSSAYINLKESLNKFLIYYFLQTNEIQYYFNSELTGTTIKNLSLKSLKNTPIKIPSVNEQQKIGSFLLFVDKKINLLNQEIKLVKEYKKGLLQNMFC